MSRKRELPPGAAILWCPGCKNLLYAMGTRETGMVAGCVACKFWIDPPGYMAGVGELARWLLSQFDGAKRWPTLQEVYDEAVRLGLPAKPPPAAPPEKAKAP